MAWSNEARPLKATILMQLVSGLDNPHVLNDKKLVHNMSFLMKLIFN